MRTRLLLILVGHAVAWPTVGHADRLGSTLYVRAGAVGAKWALSGYMDAQSREQELLRDAGLAPDYEDIGTTYGFAIEGGVRLSGTWSLGLSYTHERKTLTNTAEGTVAVDDGAGGTVDEFTDLTYDYTMSIWEMCAVVSYWAPFVPGLYVGVSGGFARGSLVETITVDVESQGERMSGLADGSFADDDPVAGFFAGFQHEFDAKPLVYFEAGYRLRNVGEFSGTTAGSGEVETAKAEGAMTDLFETPIGDMDFSGWYARAGVGFGFD